LQLCEAALGADDVLRAELPGSQVACGFDEVTGYGSQRVAVLAALDDGAADLPDRLPRFEGRCFMCCSWRSAAFLVGKALRLRWPR
jgi:hypothetical protein